MFGLEIIKKVKPIIFKYRGSEKYSFGVLAQELSDVLSKDEFTIMKEDEKGYIMVNYIEFVPLLIKSVKELNKRVEELEKELEFLKEKI